MTNCSCGFSPGHETPQISSTLTGILQIKVSESETLELMPQFATGNVTNTSNSFSPTGRRFIGLPTSPFCGNLVGNFCVTHCTNVRTTLHQQCGGGRCLHGPRADLAVWAALGQLQHSWEKFSIAFYTTDPNSAEH